MSQRQFLLNTVPHRLLLLKLLTREINAQEIVTSKRLIRVIAHELNNSLAPVSSLAHSARQLTANPDAAMPDDVLANALLPFYSTKAEGTGLGLTLCREIVEAHGGRLRLANRTDGGLVVTIFLPDADQKRLA